jgi:hypothetical protein
LSNAAGFIKTTVDLSLKNSRTCRCCWLSQQTHFGRASKHTDGDGIKQQFGLIIAAKNSVAVDWQR